MRALIFILGTAISAAVTGAQAQSWKLGNCPLPTRWTQEVSPTNALPEYPRPQLVRRDWLNLNGLWDLTLADGTAARILVPYPVESALSGVMKHSDRLTYRRTFEVPKAWRGQCVLLHFGAVDWEATVSLNGQTLGTHRGGYDGFSFDVTEALKAAGPQELTVEVFDPTDAGEQPHGKQVANPGGIFYTAVSGIWQTVWLEPVPKAHIEALQIVPEVDAGAVQVTVEGEGHSEVEIFEGGRKVGHARGSAGVPITVPIHNAKLWSPDSPFLYDLKVKSGRDEVTSYFGMRKISLGKDQEGRMRMLLNNQFVFQRGPLDQGYWPDGLYTAPTDAALRFDIDMIRQLGFNMTRKHVKVEPDRWYYWCDKLGLLVWQDMVSGVNKSAASRQQYEVELHRLIQGRDNHPSIIMWEVFNEGWGQFDTGRLTALVKQWDPTRLVDNASGGVDKGAGDVVDVHGVENARPRESARAAVVGESLGVYWAPEGHAWQQPGSAAAPGDLRRREDTYTGYMREFWELRERLGISAYIYTELTDVEGEMNGLLSYDRVPKYDLAHIAAANRGIGVSEPRVGK